MGDDRLGSPADETAQPVVRLIVDATAPLLAAALWDDDVVSEAPFADHVVAVLRRADERLRASSRGDLTTRFIVCRAALASLAPVHAFYVGFFRGERTLVIPYTEELGRFAGTDVQHYGRGGLSAWIRASGRVYRFSDDNGRLLGGGVPLSENGSDTRDALVVPLIQPGDGDVLGMLAVQSWEPEAFDDAVVQAAQWLARALVHSLNRDEEDALELDLYQLYPELDSRSLSRTDDLLAQIALQVDKVREAIDQAMTGDPGDLSATRRAYELCVRLHEEILSLLVRSGAPEQPVVLPTILTAREQQIADLIRTEGLSNAEIGRRLVISEKTVKGHVSGILRKLGVTQRSGITGALATPER